MKWWCNNFLHIFHANVVITWKPSYYICTNHRASKKASQFEILFCLMSVLSTGCGSTLRMQCRRILSIVQYRAQWLTCLLSDFCGHLDVSSTGPGSPRYHPESHSVTHSSSSCQILKCYARFSLNRPTGPIRS